MESLHGHNLDIMSTCRSFFNKHSTSTCDISKMGSQPVVLLFCFVMAGRSACSQAGRLETRGLERKPAGKRPAVPFASWLTAVLIYCCRNSEFLGAREDLTKERISMIAGPFEYLELSDSAIIISMRKVTAAAPRRVLDRDAPVGFASNFQLLPAVIYALKRVPSLTPSLHPKDVFLLHLQ